MGPVELLVLKFPSEKPGGGPAIALQHLVDRGMIRIIDIVLVRKSSDGEPKVFEIHELEEAPGLFEPIVSEITGLINHEDVMHLTAGLEPNSSAAVMLFENTWAKGFVDEVVAAKGEVVLNERIPRQVIEELIAAQEREEAVAAT